MMKRFVFNNYFKYMSSLSEWSSSFYVYNKKNFFVLKYNEEKVYDLFYNYFNLNLSFKGTRKNVKFVNCNPLKNNCADEFKSKKLSFIENFSHFFETKGNDYIYNLNSVNEEKYKNVIWKVFRFTRLIKYRMRKKYILRLFKNRSANRIFVSKPKIKSSVNEIIITLYIYNREKFYFSKRLSKLDKLFFYSLNINKMKKINGLILHKLRGKNYSFKQINNGIKSKLLYSKLLYFKRNLHNFNIYNNFYKKYESIHKLFNSNINNRYIFDSMKKLFYINIKKVFLYKFYISNIYLNNYKFNNNSLVELKKKLYKIYNKKVIINIINLKYLYLENTILVDGLVKKLNDRKKKALRVIRKALSLGKIVKLHPLFFRLREKRKNNCETELTKLNNKLNNLLVIIKRSKYIDIISHLKDKHVSGLRIEAKGRLTKRLTASRAVYKLSYKGSLKNIYSSYNKLSTIILRGLHKSNIEYTNINSKNRNGSYGIKYWLSSY